MNTKQHGKRRDPANQRSILIIEDEPLNMKLFALTLAKRGYQVMQAANGYHGFVLAHDDRPDLIVMDVRMPGLSGLEVTRTLKNHESTKDIPVIIATAFLINEETLRASGCDAYIAKPFAIPELIELIDSVFERTRAEVPAAAPVGSGLAAHQI